MRLTGSKSEVYLPAFKNNRVHAVEVPEDRDLALKVHIITPTYGDVRDHRRNLSKYPKLIDAVAQLATLVAVLKNETIIVEIRKLLNMADEIQHPDPFDDDIDGPYFAKHVPKIENLEIELVDGSVIPIPDGKTLWDKRSEIKEIDLFSELWLALRSRETLEQGLVQRLFVPSGLPSPPLAVTA